MFRLRPTRKFLNFVAIPYIILSLISISLAAGNEEPTSTTPHAQPRQIGNDQQKHNSLIPNHRIITGTVEGVAEDHAKVNSGDTGEISPRYLSLERAREKGFILKDEDKVQIIVNAKNHVVDYHLLDKKIDSHHKVMKGFLAQPLPVGHEHAMIKMSDGSVKTFSIRPLARSEVAALPFDTQGLFLLDETNKIASATLTKDVVAERDWARSTAFNVYRHVEGTVHEEPSDQDLTIKKDDQTISFLIWDFVKDDLNKLSKGMDVTLLIDRHDKVVGISYPTKELN